MLLCQPFNQYGGVYSFGGLAESHPIPAPPLHGGKSTFPGLIPPDGMVNSKCEVGIKPGNSNVMIGYQIDEFTHTSWQKVLFLYNMFMPGLWVW